MKAVLHILHLEDEPWDSNWLRDLLRADGLPVEIERVDTRAGFQQALERGGHALILSDYSIPGMDVLEAMRYARNRRPDLPFVFVSGTLGEDTAVEALKQGATDYVVKQRIQRFVPAVRRALREAQEDSQRRQVESQLRLSQEQLRLLSTAVASAANAISITDHNGTIQWVNPAFEQLTGYSAAEIIGQNHRVLKSEQQNPEFYEELWRTISAGRIWHGELLNRRKDGTLYHEEMTVAPVGDVSGHVTHFVSIKQDITQRNLVQSALRDAEARLRLAADATGFGAFDYFPQTGQLIWSEHTKRHFGLNAGAEVNYDVFLRGIHLLDRERIHQAVQRAMQPESGGDYKVEFRTTGLDDGQERWLEAFGRVHFDPAGKPVRFIGATLDITERKRSEAALCRGIEEQRILSEALAQLLSAEEPEKAVSALLPRVAEHLGADTYFIFMVNEEGDGLDLHSYGGIPHEMTIGIGRLQFGQTICGAVAQTRQPMVAEDIQRTNYEPAAMARALGLQVYACHPLISGTTVFGTLSFASHARTRFDSSEVEFMRLISNYAAVAIDRSRTAQRLRQGEDRLRLAVQTAELGAYERDLETNQVTLNPTCRNLLGITQGPTDADVAYRALHPDDEQRVLAQVAKAFDPEIRAICAAEFRLLRADRSVRWVAGRGRVIFEDAHGQSKPRKFLGVLQDITDRKIAEQELLRAKEQLSQSNARLERRVQERTAKLQEAVIELEQLSYSMVHDMRAPLRAIQSFGGILEQDPHTRLSREGWELLAKMRTAADRMDHLVRDALQYTKLVRQDLPLGPVDVAALARGIVETYPALQAPSAVVKVASEMPHVIANPAVLTQCLSHLLDNAVKFAKPRQSARAEVFAKKAGPGRVRIVVQDQGIGIAYEYQRKIFGMFNRLTNAGQGTGIGLAFVRKAVERMGGHLGLESEPGQGSRFWMEFAKADP